MKRKWLACLLTAAVVTTTLLGCGGSSKEKAQTGQETGSATNAVQSGTEDSLQETGTQEISAQEEYVCKIVCVGDATSESCDKVAQAASEITMAKYNTKIELVRLSYGSFAEEVNLMLSSGEKLDLFPNFAFSTITAANTGQILPLDELLPEYGKDILNAVPQTDWECVSIGGQIFGVPNNKDKAEGFGLAMRTDMLEETGYDLSAIHTEKDLEGLFAAVKEKYPDCYPLVSDNGGMGYYNVSRDDLGGDFGWLENCLDDSELKVVDWYESDTYKEIMQRRYDWAQKGYIMPDAATNTQNAYELMAAGKGFSYFCNTKPGIEAEWSRKVGKDITVVELVETYRTSGSGMNTWYIAHNSEKPERAMQVLNEIYSNPELSNILINGIEGENYLIDSEKGVLTYPDGVDVINHRKK